MVSLKSAWKPTPTFQIPLVTLKSASPPTAVFCPPQAPGGFGQPASSAGESAKQQSASAMRRKPRKLSGPIDFLKYRVVIFFVFIYVEVGLLNCINCNPVSCGAKNHPHEAL